MNKLIEVLEIQTYSGDDSMMREYLETELDSIPGVAWFDDGDNIYVTKGVAPYPCIVAHMDTVHPIVEDLTAIVIDGRITGMNAVTMEQTGIGGDDKVGIYVALQMLRQHENIKVFFPRDEEIGCVGSRLVDPKFFDDVTIALQCDRRGNTDMVINASGVELSSKAFQDDVLPILQRYGYKFSDGMMTDVMELKQSGINVSMANISCGYYHPHCKNEYVNVADVDRVTTMVSEIIQTLGGTFYPHEAPDWDSWMDNDDDFGWGKDNIALGSSTSDKSLLALNYCMDCHHEPATSKNGLCDKCEAWYEQPFNISADSTAKRFGFIKKKKK